MTVKEQLNVAGDLAATIRKFAEESRVLEPDAKERQRLLSRVNDFAETFLEAVDTRPAPRNHAASVKGPTHADRRIAP